MLSLDTLLAFALFVSRSVLRDSMVYAVYLCACLSFFL